jgi:hypothetical protein
MNSSIVLGLLSVLALAVVGAVSNAATPVFAADDYKDKVHKIVKLCDKVYDGYKDKDYNFDGHEYFKVFKLCEEIIKEKKIKDMIMND